MSDQTGPSEHGTSEQLRKDLIYVLGPLYARLLAIGVTQLQIEYEAQEGVGEVRTRASNALGKVVTVDDDEDLKARIRLFVILLLEHRNPDWSVSAGGHGRIDWNLVRNDLTHTHHQRTVTVTTSKYCGF